MVFIVFHKFPIFGQNLNFVCISLLFVISAKLMAFIKLQKYKIY